jgi:putative FmdB family regulatory protein
VPIYEYRCPNGHTFEVFQKMSDPPVGSCEVCGAGPVEKVLYPVAVHFKGKGFYTTDYGRGSRSGGSKDTDSGGSSKDSSGDGSAAATASEKKASSTGEGGKSSSSTSD